MCIRPNAARELLASRVTATTNSVVAAVRHLPSTSHSAASTGTADVSKLSGWGDGQHALRFFGRQDNDILKIMQGTDAVIEHLEPA